MNSILPLEFDGLPIGTAASYTGNLLLATSSSNNCMPRLLSLVRLYTYFDPICCSFFLLFLVSSLVMLLKNSHGVTGNGASGNRICQISNHRSNLCFSWFFLWFCRSSASHCSSLIPSLSEGSPLWQGSSRCRCLVNSRAREGLLRPWKIW